MRERQLDRVTRSVTQLRLSGYILFGSRDGDQWKHPPCQARGLPRGVSAAGIGGHLTLVTTVLYHCDTFT
eukprot:702411-Hanusia_phi.AAC.1